MRQNFKLQLVSCQPRYIGAFKLYRVLLFWLGLGSSLLVPSFPPLLVLCLMKFTRVSSSSIAHALNQVWYPTLSWRSAVAWQALQSGGSWLRVHMVLQVGNLCCGVLKLCNLESLDSEFTWCWKLGTSIVGLGLGSLLSPVPGPSIAGLKSCQKNRTIDSACKLELDQEPGTSLRLELDPDRTHFVQVPVLQCFCNYLFLFFPSRVQQVFNSWKSFKDYRFIFE